VFRLHAEISKGGAIRWQFVSHNGIRRVSLLLQQFAHQLHCSFPVSTCLDQDIENFAFAVDRAPQVHALAIDQDEDFVEMPARIGSWPCTSEFRGEYLPELQGPAPDGFVGNINGALGEQIRERPPNPT
jgi:hypothetical protein